MSGQVRDCFADDDISEVLKLMEERHVRRLPALDPEGHLAGILSIDDVTLRGLDGANGAPQASFVGAMTQLCTRPSIEPEMNFTETFVSG